MMTNSDVVALLMPLAATGAVLLTGVAVVYRATHRKSDWTLSRDLRWAERIVGAAVLEHADPDVDAAALAAISEAVTTQNAQQTNTTSDAGEQAPAGRSESMANKEEDAARVARLLKARPNATMLDLDSLIYSELVQEAIDRMPSEGAAAIAAARARADHMHKLIRDLGPLPDLERNVGRLRNPKSEWIRNLIRARKHRSP